MSKIDEILNRSSDTWDSNDGEDIRNEIKRLTDDIKGVREVLWVNHGHNGLYGDDGEMQCGLCAVNSYPEKIWDYKRSDIVSLTKKLWEF